MDASWVLWPVALLMALTVAALVRWSTEARTVVAAAVVLFLFVMMAAMFVGVWIYFSWPGSRSLVLGLWIAAALMSASVFPVIGLILRESRDHLLRGGSYRPRPLPSTALLAISITALVLVSELLMGRSFALASGDAARTGGGALASVLSATVASPWFLFPMSFEMGFTLYWLRARLPSALLGTLATQSLMMFFAPPALAGELWLLVSGTLSSVVMSVLLAYLLYRSYRASSFGRAVRSYLVRFFLVTALMGLGLALWIAIGDLSMFAVAMVLEMVIFFTAVVVPESFQVRTPPGPASAGRGENPAGSV